MNYRFNVEDAINFGSSDYAVLLQKCRDYIDKSLKRAECFKSRDGYAATYWCKNDCALHLPWASTKHIIYMLKHLKDLGAIEFYPLYVLDMYVIYVCEPSFKP